MLFEIIPDNVLYMFTPHIVWDLTKRIGTAAIAKRIGIGRGNRKRRATIYNVTGRIITPAVQISLNAMLKGTRTLRTAIAAYGKQK